jgi:sec-independent protein translocase protein TatA
MFTPGFQEIIVIGVIAVLLFGKRLPEVAKSLGKSYNEFRKGLADIQSSIDYDSYSSPNSSNSYSSSSTESGQGTYDDYDDYDEPAAPKFEPPPSEPHTASNEAPPSDDIAKPVHEK